MNDNAAFLASLNHVLAFITLIGFIVLVVWLIDLILVSFGHLKEGKRHRMLAKYALPLGFFGTLAAMLFSLYYTYGLQVIPCELCWFQRIFVYSLVFVFGMAWYKNDKKIFDYTMLLSGVGLAIAVYHHYLQLGYNLLKPCSTAPFAVDCAVPTFVEFDFVTFPLMAAVILGGVLLLSYTAKKFSK
jgi:disulfide bond formation protein DsbB